MNSQTSKLIIKDLCRRLNISEKQAIEIIKSQFRLVRKTIESYDYEEENYPAIRLPKFGIFYVKGNKKKNEKTD